MLDQPDHGLTPAQETMRQELLAPQPMLDIFNEVLGKLPQVEPVVSELALEVIKEGPNLELSLKQWTIVQGLIEAGVQVGMARGACQHPAD